jgi:N-glycosylase/DNA lyase
VPLCAISGQVFRWERESDGRIYGVDGGNVYWVAISDDHLDVETNATEQAFKDLFRLEQSLDKIFQEILSLGPELEPYAEGYPGLRIMKPSCPVEVAISFLCSPNNSLHRIVPMVKKLAERGDLILEAHGRAPRRFPETEVIAGISEQELRDEKFGYRARTIPDIAKQMSARGGRRWLEDLINSDYEHAHSELTSLNGVGPKLADCIALFGLNFTEAVPLDTHIWQSVGRLYFLDLAGKAVTPQRYAKVSLFLRDRFGPLAGWAQQLLFFDSLTRQRATIEK